MLKIAKKAMGLVRSGKACPLWFDTVVNKYPPLTFSAPKPIDFRPPHLRRKLATNNSIPKKPPKLEYPEDKYRKRFFKEHRVELFRPSSLNDSTKAFQQASPDQVIDYQLKLMEHGFDAEKAYKMACEKFYQDRMKLEAEQKLASEEIASSNFHTEPATQVVQALVKAEREAVNLATRNHLAKKGLNL